MRGVDGHRYILCLEQCLQGDEDLLRQAFAETFELTYPMLKPKVWVVLPQTSSPSFQTYSSVMPSAMVIWRLESTNASSSLILRLQP